MITSQCIQRMALSAALLVLPLIIYCGDIVGNPQNTAGTAEQAGTATPPVSTESKKVSGEKETQVHRILADIGKRDPAPVPGTHVD